MSTSKNPILLVASDLREHSDAIVHAASVFAGQSGAELHICHVIEPPGWTSRIARVIDPPLTTRVADNATFMERTEKLQQQARRILTQEMGPERLMILARDEPPFQQILEHARAIGATYLAIGPHSGSKAAARFLGTTAERIIRTSPIPCLLFRGLVIHPPRRVGAAIDLSACSPMVLREAAHWAGQCHRDPAGATPSSVDVVYVGWWVEREDVPDIEQATVRPAIEAAIKQAKGSHPILDNCTFQTTVLWENEPIQPILQWAASSEVDLLVLGTHGLRGLKRTLLGSTAISVAQQATCPILLVPPASSETV